MRPNDMPIFVGSICLLAMWYGYNLITRQEELEQYLFTGNEISDLNHTLRAAYHITFNDSVGLRREKQLRVNFLESMPYLKLHRTDPVSLSDPRISNYRIEREDKQQVLSNLYSHVKMWDAFAQDEGAREDQWALFLEDDAAFHVRVRGHTRLVASIFNELFQLAKADEFGYFGLCKPYYYSWYEMLYNRCSTNSKESLMKDGVLYERTCGNCAHAYAMTKRRARSMWRMLASRNYTLSSSPCIWDGKHLLNHFDYFIFMDRHLDCWSAEELGGVWLAGADLASNYDPGHLGILYQERSLGQSVHYV